MTKHSSGAKQISHPQEITDPGQKAIASGKAHLAQGEAQAAYQDFSQAVAYFCQHIRRAQAAAEHWRGIYLQELLTSRQSWAQLAAHPWLALAYSDPAWEAFSPDLETGIPPAVRAGRLDLPAETGLGDVPAFVPFIGENHLFLQGANANRTRLLAQALLLRLVLSAAPGSLRLALFDPSGAGANLAPFLKLPDKLRGAKIYSRPEEIERQMDALYTHIEEVTQNRLLNVYPTLADYNASAGEMAVPHTVVALLDFPAAFSERAAERLLAIAQNGRRAGVFLLVHNNPQKYEPPRNFEPQKLYALGLTLTLAGEYLSWADHGAGETRAIPDDSPSSERSNTWLNRIGSALQSAVQDLSFRRLAIPPAQRWQGDASEGLQVPIGLSSSGEIQTFELGTKSTVHHGLIGGTTGSGKTNLLHVLINQLALKYAPEELALYLLDFKEGVEFQDYLALPHARVVALETEREYALNILRRLSQEREQRGLLFKEAGANSLADYRRRSGQRLPRILLIIDEFKAIFLEDDRLAQEALRLLVDMVSRGRAFGIHALLSAQSPAGGLVNLLPVYNQMGLRIALKCQSQNDARAILGEENSAADGLEKAGEAIYNDENGRKEKNILMRAALLPKGDIPAVLQEIGELSQGRQYALPATFESSAPARLEDCPGLFQPIQDPPAPLMIWLGEPVEIKEPTHTVIERYLRSNLMILGGSEDQAHGLLVAALFSLAAQRSPDGASFIVADFARPTSACFGLFNRLAAELSPYALRVCGPRDTGALLAELSEQLARRMAEPSVVHPDSYFLVAGLHRWRELRPEAGKFGLSPAAAALAKLVEDGPDYGMHLVAWCDSLSFLDAAFNRKGLEPFDLRVALRLSETESVTLFGNKSAAALKDNRALYRHEDWELGQSEKFKPYSAPAAETLAELARRLRER